MRSFWKGVGSVAAAALAAKLIAELVKCCRDRRYYPEPKTTVDYTDCKYIPNQLIVWKRPGVSEKDFREWKRDNKPKDVRQIKLCEYCDDSLELWEGDNVSTFITGKGGTVGNPPGGGGLTGGGDNIACYSYNLIIDLPEPGICVQENDREYSNYSEQSNSDEPPIIVAVFDTGLDPLIKQFYTSSVFSCMPGGNLGWNFFDKNDDTTDDHPSKHGSVVSKFIIDQAIKYQKQRVNILPVKVHNKLGKSDLFSILCGFAYSANCGAKIINASFGFYAPKNSKAPAILADFVKKYLSDKNILLVAAAGNVNADRSFIPSNKIEDLRNLNIHPFFPACLSANFENVLAVTTTSFAKNAVSPSQNFSNVIVDIGVRCDMEIADDYRFADSLERHDPLGGLFYVLGSSFATPIVTGILAQHYKEVISSMVNGSINKNSIIQKLQESNSGLIISANTTLDSLIKNGNCCEK